MILDHQVAVVTGAGTAIGRELAKAFAREGAFVVCVGRRQSLLDETVAELGGRGSAVAVDVTDPAAVRELMDATAAEHGRIDIVFANAGSYAAVGPIWDEDPERWWDDVSVNLRGTMLCARYAIPHMIAAESGLFISMDGGGGSNGPTIGGSGYGSSKAAIVRFGESLARELESIDSPVLSIMMSPGFVRSDMTEGLINSPERAKWNPWVVDSIGEKARPASDCADATLRLLGILGPELNGCTFGVDTDFDEVDGLRAGLRNGNLLTMRMIPLPAD